MRISTSNVYCDGADCSEELIGVDIDIVGRGWTRVIGPTDLDLCPAHTASQRAGLRTREQIDAREKTLRDRR